MPKVKPMSKAEYARHRGVSGAAVTKAVKTGRITVLADGQIDPVAADAQWANNSRPKADVGPPAAPAPKPSSVEVSLEPQGHGGALKRAKVEVEEGEPDYWKARARREEAEAQLSEIKLAETSGQLIRADAIRSQLARVLSATRDSLMQIPARLAAVLAAESDPAKVHDQLQTELHQSLSQLAVAPDRIGAAT